MSKKQYYYFVVQVKDKSEKYYYSYVEVYTTKII